MSDITTPLAQPGTLQVIDRDKMRAAVRALGVDPEAITSVTLNPHEATFTVAIPFVDMSLNQHLVEGQGDAS